MDTERFVVKHYTSENHPVIIGNGFQIEIAESREEADEFIHFVNRQIRMKTDRSWAFAYQIDQTFYIIDEKALGEILTDFVTSFTVPELVDIECHHVEPSSLVQKFQRAVALYHNKERTP